MIYTALVRKASQIAYRAHLYDTDKGGYPYIFHPFYLASQMDNEAAICTALLHDVIEDHGDQFGFDYLAGCGFTEDILTALRLLTHDDAVPYKEYVKSLAENDIARAVKMADLRHNLDASRTNGQAPPKAPLYRWALEYLENMHK